jgi:K+-sensing histidine kinase KdpD
MTVAFVVTDTGIGIAEADQQRIFGAFQQATWTGTNASEGTGLGLSIARGLAVRMGGDITCRSELRKGSCFTFTARIKMSPQASTVDKPTQVRWLGAAINSSSPSYHKPRNDLRTG